MTDYDSIADLYDLFYKAKDYAGEAAQVLEIARMHTSGTRLLDIGCGTGKHLERFSGYERSGFDLSEGMIEKAKLAVPDARLWTDDMRGFDANGTYDVIVSLFSAIGYVTDLDDLRAVFAGIAAALAPGGVAIIEPWLSAAEWKPDYVIHEYYEAEHVVRFMTSYREGALMTMTMHVLAARNGRIQHLADDHVMRFYDRDPYEKAAKAAGLALEETKGFGRKLLVLTHAPSP